MSHSNNHIDLSTVRFAATGLAARLADLFSRNRRRFKSIALVLALALFCGGLIISLQASPDIWARIRIGPLLVILLVATPVGLAINAMDFQVLARLSGVDVRFRQAVEIAVYTRAANMLPIPGSMAVRMAALKSRGATFKRSGGLIFLLTVIWGGVGFCFSGAWLAVQAPPVFSVSFTMIGVAMLTGCAMAVRRFRLDPVVVLQAAGLRFLAIALDALVLMIAVWAVGAEAAYHQTAILVVSSFVASVAPAGLGVRETIIALLSPIAGIDAATGFLAGAVVRFAGMAFLAACSLVMAVLSRRSDR